VFVKKRLTIIAVAMLLVSVSLLSSVVEASTTTSLTITPSPTNPASTQPFTLSGTLKAGTTLIPCKTITLHRQDPSGTWSTANTTTTDANGAYTFTRNESLGSYHYFAYFSGDTTSYNASTSPTLALTVGT
jgi:hypothetical protein